MGDFAFEHARSVPAPRASSACAGLGVLLLVGCSPTLEVTPPTGAVSGEPLQVAASIEPNGTTASERFVRVRRQAPTTGPEEVDDTLEALGGNAWRASFPGIPYGDWQATLVVRHNGRVYPPGSVTSSDSANFTVLEAPDPACFRFDTPVASGAAPDDWHLTGIYLATDDSQEWCAPVQLHQLEAGWPWAGGGAANRSAAFSVSPSCLAPGIQDPPGFDSIWYLFAVSPDVAAVPGWQDAAGLRFRVWSALPNTTVAGILYVTMPDGTQQPVVGPDVVIEDDVWVSVDVPLDMPPDAVVGTVNLRIQNIYGLLGEAAPVRIDHVCPIPAS